MSEDLAYAPPQNLDAERSVLEACLIDTDAISKIRDLLPSDFYRSDNRNIFSAICNLHEKDEPIDQITVTSLAKDQSPLIRELAISAVTSANVAYHARMIKDASIKRQIIASCRDAIQNAMDPLETIEDILAELRTKIQGVFSGVSGEIISSKQMAKETFEKIEKRSLNPSELSGIKSGFLDVDTLTDGWQPGELIIIAARPGIGKSAFAMACCQNAEVPVGFLSLEMGTYQLGIRSLASLSGVDLWKLRKGFIKDAWAPLTRAASDMAEMELYFSFTSRNTAQVERTVTQMIEKYGIKMLVVDYLQLVKSVADKKREQEVSEVSRLLKGLSIIHNIPVISLAQLNRASEKEKRKPILSDLRESGQIEADADVVIFLHEDKVEPSVLNVDFAKGRNMELNTVRLAFEKNTMTFRNYSEKRKRDDRDDDTF